MIFFRKIEFPEEALTKAENESFQLSGYEMQSCSPKNKERRIKIGLIQNKIVLPTNAPIPDQVRSDFESDVRINSLKKIF